MSKVAGSYESVVRGVSQQVAQDRRSGQHAEQINMISDPVTGLARRHGSMVQDEQHVVSMALNDLISDTARHKSFTFFVAGVGYDFIYRQDASVLGQGTFAWAFNKVTGKFIPIVYNTGDTVLNSLVSGGVSAAANVGKYLFLAGNTIVPTWTPTDAWGASANQSYAAAWVRGGAYKRTFKLTVALTTGPSVVVSYTTLSAGYPGILDTSGISIYTTGTTIDPEYQKHINDATNDYNSAVTAWITTSAQDITPQNIAQKLVDALNTAGVSSTRLDGTVCITDTRVRDLTADDGGDGTLLRAVGNEIIAPDLVSVIHHAGKVVKVRPKHNDGSDAFYLRAKPTDTTATGFTEVTWEETAGYVMQPNSMIVMGTVVGGTLYLASSAAGLATIAGGTHPAYVANAVGDTITSPLPNFFGKTINYLGVFQDRLVVGSGAVLTFSKPGDYFDFFRLSVLTVADNDPWEGFALGAEDDVITSSTLYDRNLVLHGAKFWYQINGRQPFTPRTASIVTGSAYKDANYAPPVSIGNFTMYAKYSGLVGKEYSSLHQVQAGVVQDDPESNEISQQLDTYIVGKPVQIAAITTPNMVFLRTEKTRMGLYVYGYLDQAGGQRRLLDNWSRWAWDARVGYVTAISTVGPDLLVYLVKRNASGQNWVSCERFTMHAGLSDYPYADSLRPIAAIASGYMLETDAAMADATVAFQESSPYRFLGSSVAQAATLRTDYPDNIADLWAGIPFPASFTPTNPYVQDKNNNSVLAGRLTLGNVKVALADSGGVLVDVTSTAGVYRAVDFSGRILAGAEALIGRQPIVSTSLSAVVGKEIRECSYTISAKTWLPLTVTSLEWTGQYFNNVRRV